MEIGVVYVTCPSAAVATTIARTLLDERLIACANVFPAITSIYRWEGAVEQASEVALLLKTSTIRISEVVQRAQQLHPYTCPGVTAWTATQGAEPYFQWVEAETRAPASEVP